MAELRVGEIAVWFDGKNLVSHRVVEIGTDTLSTRPDSRTTLDAPVEPCQLLGRAVRFSKGPISYPLDGPWVEFLSRVAMVPWARLLEVARWARTRLKRR
jgi:hypothetical protein